MKKYLFGFLSMVIFACVCFAGDVVPTPEKVAWYVATVKWITANYANVFLALAAMVGVAEIIVRMTPTKKDDGAVERIGKILKSIMDFLKVPNLKK